MINYDVPPEEQARWAKVSGEPILERMGEEDGR